MRFDYMVTKMISAFVLAFLISIGIGRIYIPWLRHKGYSQPLKHEVAQMYEGKNEEKREDG